MVGFELVGLGSPMVRLLAATRPGNDTTYTVQRCAYDPSRYRYGVDTRLPAPYRRFDVVMGATVRFFSRLPDVLKVGIEQHLQRDVRRRATEPYPLVGSDR